MPENIWFERTLGSKEKWNPSFGTIIRVETREHPSPGTQIQLYVHDRDGSPWVHCCSMHRKKTQQSFAFIFRDPHAIEKIYPVTVSCFT